MSILGRIPMPDPLPTLPPMDPPDSIDLGTCVRLWLSWHPKGKEPTDEGVVIEVVPPNSKVRSARVWRFHTQRSRAERYVIQCWEKRVVRRAADIRVVSL